METLNEMKARDILSEARAIMVIQAPFFGTLSIYMQPEEKSNVKTCATDGNKFFYCPEWVEEIFNKASGNSTAERRREGFRLIEGVVAHEVMHAALGHIWRKEERYHLAWNMACDYAINWILKEAGMKLPEGTLYDDKYANQPAEEIYARFKLDNIKNEMNQAWGDHSMWGQPGDGQSDDHGEDERESDHGKMSAEKYAQASAMAEEWASRAVSAAQAANGQGKLPDSIKRLIEKALEPQISWREVLSELLQPRRTDYTYFPMDRRFVHSEIYIPDFGGIGIEDIVIAYDTSGSIDDDTLCKFSAECQGILSMHGRSRVHVVSCDAAVHTWETLESSDEWPTIEPEGGGGTDFRPVFDEVVNRDIQPSVVVFLTDGYGYAPEEDPGYPVLWVVTPGGQEPCDWGRTIKMLDQ